MRTQPYGKIETFTIEVYSDSIGPFSVWADHWRCPVCYGKITPETLGRFGKRFGTHCPLHNPMRCSGTLSGERHGYVSCDPFGDVFLLRTGGPYNEHAQPTEETRTVIGRVPERTR